MRLVHDRSDGIPCRSSRKLTVIFDKLSSSHGDRWAPDMMKLVRGVEILEVVGERNEFLSVWHEKEDHHRIYPLLLRLSIRRGGS